MNRGDNINSFFEIRQWELVDTILLESREKCLEPIDDLPLSNTTLNYIKTFVPGIYLHQKEALKYSIGGYNVCLVTGTASGKSLAFYALGIEKLVAKPSAKIIAIYPLKALGREQEKRWKNALDAAGINAKVGRIDGDVKSMARRKAILKDCQVVIMTPDIIHHWLLLNISDREIVKFLTNVALFVVDEVHTYTGVFGSNAAFLFRRLRHLIAFTNNTPQFICASATMASPEKHLENLFGVPFHIIGSELDTSPRQEVKIVFLRPHLKGDYLTEITYFLKELTSIERRFIAFVDSRKSAELITSILSRGHQGREQGANIEVESDKITGIIKPDRIHTLNILPYRSGYEEEDQIIIQERLYTGSLSGVVSTSALELGLDIADLSAVVLLGVPYSSTSLLQRMGRVGRNCPGTVYIIHSGDVVDEVVFRNPKSILERPLSEGALYLQNPRIQYIHTLCLSREGGEHDQFCQALKISNDETDFISPIKWPEGFMVLCKSERTGELPSDLQAMKSEANDCPNNVFPLRDVESQFKVQFKQGPVLKDMGSLSYSQALREAYPGAVYYYATESLRVYKIFQKNRLIYVRSEKKYTTNPSMPPSQVFPNFTEGNIYNSNKYGDLMVIEANCQVRESVIGFKEKRGSAETKPYKYPLTGDGINVFFDLPRFTRNYFTSGVVFTHPTFNIAKTDELGAVSRLIYEAFLISIPFERQDLDVAFGKFRVKRLPYIQEGNYFIVIYDRTYGSLRLSGHVMAENQMGTVFKQALEIARLSDEVMGPGGVLPVTAEVIALLETLCNDGSLSKMQVDFESSTETMPDENRYERIIMPGGIGLAARNNNSEYIIENIFFYPKQKELCYRGRYLTQSEQDTVNVTWPVKEIREVPGESVIGYYDYETGELLTDK
ncbi:DEAD/DEAH box helicase [Desulfofarcimen acetoxidans]|nr:DEAD/DEAH box helicase [Desulfofarcimen acetoxidans]